MLGACRCAGCVPGVATPPGVCVGDDVGGVDCAAGAWLDAGGGVVPLCCAHATLKKGKRPCDTRTSTTQISARPSKPSRAKVVIPLFFGSDSEALFPTSSSISKPLADTLKPNHTRREKGTASAPSLLENVKPVDYLLRWLSSELLNSTEAAVPATSLLGAPFAKPASSASDLASASLPPACGCRDGSPGPSPASDRRSVTSHCSPPRSEPWHLDEFSSSVPFDHLTGSGPVSPARSVVPGPLGPAPLPACRLLPAPALAIRTPSARRQQTTRHFELSSYSSQLPPWDQSPPRLVT